MTVFDACLDSKHWKNLRIIVGGHTHTRIHRLGCTPPTTKQKIPGVPRVGSSRNASPYPITFEYLRFKNISNPFCRYFFTFY